jgi:hypothetical protein
VAPTVPEGEPNPLVALLRQCIVQIDDNTGAFRGTGFFVAPGCVLTCAHVVHKARGLLVRWQDHAVPTTAARAVPPLESVTDARSYPPPDLAILNIAPVPEWDHPCARLTAESPVLGESLYLAGYTIEHDSIPALTGATTEFESVITERGHKFYKLKRGQLLSGFSGSPVLNRRTGLITGIVESTRGHHSDLGGFAVPASEAAAAFPELADQNRRFHEANGQWIEAAEAERTLDDERAGERGRLPLRRPMAQLEPGAVVSAATLLRPRYAVVGYVGREKLLADLAAWCETDQPGPQLWFVTGPGGLGKTRLAVQATTEAEDRGWTSGLLRDDVSDASLQALADWRGRLLIAVDYAETRPAIVRRLVEEFTARERRPPVRIILLVRRPATRDELLTLFNEHRDEDLGALLRRAQQSALDHAPVEVDRLALFNQAVRDLSLSGAQGNSLHQPQLRAAHYGRPLYVLVAALLAGSSSRTDVDALGEDDLLRQLVSEHEANYWDLWAKRRKLSLDPEDQRAAVAVATLLTARGDHEALTITRLIPHHADEPESRLIAIARWLGQLYPADGQPGQINIGALEPDRLGEVLAADVLRQHPTLLTAAMTAASDRQLTNLLTVAARTARDDHEVRSQLQDCLDTRVGDLINRALTPPGSYEMLTAMSGAAAIARPDRPDWLHWALGTLSVREAGILSMRLGLTDGQPKTLDEISREYGLTRERVRQIEMTVLSKLRHPSRALMLVSPDYMDWRS